MVRSAVDLFTDELRLHAQGWCSGTASEAVRICPKLALRLETGQSLPDLKNS
jgi:hypothetical protein